MPECDGCGSHFVVNELELACTECMFRVCADCKLDQENGICPCGQLIQGDVPPEVAALMAKLDGIEDATAKLDIQNGAMNRENKEMRKSNEAARAQLEEAGGVDDLERYLQSMLGDLEPLPAGEAASFADSVTKKYFDAGDCDDGAKARSPECSSTCKGAGKPGHLSATSAALDARTNELQSEIAQLERQLAEASPAQRRK